jgi:hypothetical protein
MLKRDSSGRLVEPEYCDMRRRFLARIASGQLTEDFDLSKVLDSSELVELTMEVEESGAIFLFARNPTTIADWTQPDFR